MGSLLTGFILFEAEKNKPHPVLHGIGLVLSVILLVAVLVGTYVLSTMATIIDSFIGAPSGHYSDAEIADTKVKAEALAADVEAEGTVLVRNNDNTLPLAADNKKINVFGCWAAVPAPAACPASTPICWPR